VAAQDDELLDGRPWSPPIVELAGDGVAHLLCWEQHERDGSWYAWVSWIQSTGDPVRHRHHVVSVRADAVRRLENPEVYARVPRRTLGGDGQIRPWTPAAPSTPDAHYPGNESGQDGPPGREHRR
jgi:hypothetical protein